jgi:hypothetical protein
MSTSYCSNPINVSAVGAYPTNPQVTIPFAASSVVIAIEDDPATPVGVKISFNGVDDAVVLIAGRPTGAMVWEGNTPRRIWMKAEGTGATAVRVMANQGSGG